MRVTNDQGVDVVYEHVGGELFQEGLESLAKDGRLVTCGAHSGEVVPFDIIPFFRRQLSVIGSFVFTREEVELCFRLVAQGALRPQVAATFPLEQGEGGDRPDGESRVLREDRPPSRGVGREAPRRGRRRHVHRPDLRRRRGGDGARAQAADDPGRPVPGDDRRDPGAGRDGRHRPGRPRPGLPRHHDRDEHRDRARRRHGRDDHDRGLPRHPPHRAAQEALQLLELPGSALAAVSAGPAASPAHRPGADDEGGDSSRPARRGARAGAGAAAQGSRGRRRRGLLPLLLPEPRARAARGRDRPGGVPGGLPLRLVGGPAAVPRVRALLDGVPERLRRPQGRQLRRAAAVRADRARRAHGAAPDDLRKRRRDPGGRGGPSREPAHVRAGRRRRRRDLGREAGRLRQRDHARRGRHVRRHRAGAGGPAAHEASAGHEGRPLPGDDPDGRRRHDRRRRWLDRLRRRGRHLPRGAALGRCGARARLLRQGRYRADRDRRDGEPRLAARGRFPRGRDGAARRPRPDVVRARPGQGARHDGGGGLDGGRPDPHALDGAVDRGELGAEGVRPARLRARRRGRRRAAVRGRDRARGRHALRARASLPGGDGRDGPPGHRHGLRVRHHHVPAPLGARRTRRSSGRSRTWRRRRASSSRRTASRRIAS